MNQEDTTENENQHIDAADAAFSDVSEPPEDQPMTRDEEMDRLRETADMADRRVLQAQAEAENFRKRMRRDMDEQLKFAAVPLVSDLLQVRDNLNRAVEASGTEAGGEGLRGGVEVVIKLFDDTMAKHGIREIPAEGELFDPNLHEALSQMPSDTVAAGMVAMVAQAGFQMHERVIRPTQVIVSVGPPQG